MPKMALVWDCKYELRKFHGESTDLKDLYEVLEGEGNLLTYGGGSALWNRLTSSSPSVTVFDDTNAYIGVGDSTTASAATMNALVSEGGNAFRKIANMTHTDATSAGAQSVTFVASFSTAEANFVWNEWGIFNAASSGRMLNRKVEALGTKTSAATWQLTITLTFGTVQL